MLASCLKKTNTVGVCVQQPKWEEKTKQIAIKNMCSSPNSTPKPATGSRIWGDEEQKRSKAAVVQRLMACWLNLGTEGKFMVLLCPWGRWLGQSYMLLVLQSPLMGGQWVLHYIQPPISPSVHIYSLATTVRCSTQTVSAANSYCLHYHNRMCFMHLLVQMRLSLSIRRCVSAKERQVDAAEQGCSVV